MGTVAGFVLASAFGFTGPERVAFVLQCAMPVAVYNYLFAQMYNNDPEDVASLVIVSTVLSVVTTPILLALTVKWVPHLQGGRHWRMASAGRRTM